jgi:hypothetical protein
MPCRGDFCARAHTEAARSCHAARLAALHVAHRRTHRASTMRRVLAPLPLPRSPPAINMSLRLPFFPPFSPPPPPYLIHTAAQITAASVSIYATVVRRLVDTADGLSRSIGGRTPFPCRLPFVRSRRKPSAKRSPQASPPLFATRRRPSSRPCRSGEPLAP